MRLDRITSNKDLLEFARSIALPINHILYQSDLKSIVPRSGNYIINLGSPESGGTHWVALKLLRGAAYYFDSFGLSPPKSIDEFMHRWPGLNYHMINDIQNINSGYCGSYSIAFLAKVHDLHSWDLFVRQFKNYHFKYIDQLKRNHGSSS